MIATIILSFKDKSFLFFKILIGIFTQKVPDAENLIADMNKEILEAQK